MFETVGTALLLFVITWAIVLLPFWVKKLATTVFKKPETVADAWFIKSYTVWLFFILAMGIYALNVNGVAFWIVLEDLFVPLAIINNFDVSRFPNLFSVALALIQTTGFVLACSSFGVRILTYFMDILEQNFNPLMIVNVGFLLGASIIATIWVFFAVFGVFTQSVIWATLAIAFLAGVLPLVKLLNQTRVYTLSGVAQLRKVGRLWQVLAFLSVVTLALTVFQAWAQLSFDASIGYFANSTLTALSGELQYANARYLVISGFHTEILYAGLQVIFDDYSARLLSWFIGISVVISVVSIALALKMRLRAIIFVVAMIASTSAFMDLLGDGKIDLSGVALVLVVIALLMQSKTITYRKLTLTSLFSAWAILSKPTYAPLLAIFVLVMLLRQAHYAKQKLLYQILWLAWPASIVLGLHIVRNILWLGEPTGLMFFSKSPQLAEVAWGYGESFASFLRASFPLFSTHLPINVSIGTLSQLWVLTLPLVAYLFARKGSYELSFIIKLTITTLVAWVAFSPAVAEHRYVLAFTFIMYFMGAVAVDNKDTPPQIRKLLLIASLILLAYAPFRAIATPILAPNTPEPFAGSTCEQNPECMVIRTINSEASMNERVLPLMQYTSYLRDDLLQCIPDEVEWLKLLDIQENQPAKFWETLYVHGFDMIGTDLIYAGFSRQLNPIKLENIPEWLTIETRYYDEHNGYYFAVYELIADNPPDGLVRQSCADLNTFIPAYQR